MRPCATRGYPPTVREIGEAVGLTSSSSVHAQLANLERMGLLHKDPTKPRAMTLATDEAKAAGTTVPLLGRIAAGTPMLATEQVEDYVAVPADFTSSGDHFALRVLGDSMVEAGILDGDLVVVKSQEAADDGDIVAALMPGPAEDEATVKRLGPRRATRDADPGEPDDVAVRDDRRTHRRQGGRRAPQALSFG